MAALRHGIRTVIIPKANEKDLADIDPTVRSALQFVTAETVERVLETALLPVEPVTAPILCDLPVKASKSKNVIRQ